MELNAAQQRDAADKVRGQTAVAALGADLGVGRTLQLSRRVKVKAGTVVFRCGGSEVALALSQRDIHLVDDEYFLRRTANYRRYLGLEFVEGLKPPPEGVVLATHNRGLLLAALQGLQAALVDQQDLITFSYQFRFSGDPQRSGGGAVSGFRVGSHFGYITAEPSRYCTMTLSSVAPSGRSRLVQIIDMRLHEPIDTDWGRLSVTKRPAEVGWFTALPPVLSWLEAQTRSEVEVLHGPAS